MDTDIRKFIFDDLQAIDGYIDPPDALAFFSLLQSQETGGLTGGIAEIGVFYGRSYFLLRKIAGPREKILAIDLFTLPQDGHTSQYDRFVENGRRLGLPVDENLIVRGDSTQLWAADITGRVGKVRFFGIDGGHMLRHVLADGRLAMDSITEHGIIAFDDTFNPAWPEVTIGLADLLRDSGGAFCAFCMTKYRTYVCRREFHGFYRQVIANAEHLTAFDHVETEFLGTEATRLHNPMKRRMAHELMNRLGMRAFSEKVYR